jgi:hypothetical protein
MPNFWGQSINVTSAIGKQRKVEGADLRRPFATFAIFALDVVFLLRLSMMAVGLGELRLGSANFLESLVIRRPYGALTTGKSLVVPSCGGKYHAPSIPIDLHLDSSRVPA